MRKQYGRERERERANCEKAVGERERANCEKAIGERERESEL